MVSRNKQKFEQLTYSEKKQPNDSNCKRQKTSSSSYVSYDAIKNDSMHGLSGNGSDIQGKLACHQPNGTYISCYTGGMDM